MLPKQNSDDLVKWIGFMIILTIAIGILSAYMYNTYTHKEN